MRIFQFDPFTYRPREQSTVGALRAEAADWTCPSGGSHAAVQRQGRRRHRAAISTLMSNILMRIVEVEVDVGATTGAVWPTGART